MKTLHLLKEEIHGLSFVYSHKQERERERERRKETKEKGKERELIQFYLGADISS